MTPTPCIPTPIHRILDLGALPPELPLTEERLGDIAHEAARLGYDAAQINVRGLRVGVVARFCPARFCRRAGLQRIRPTEAARQRHHLLGAHPQDTAQP